MSILQDTATGNGTISRLFDERNRVTSYTDNQGHAILYVYPSVHYDHAGNVGLATVTPPLLPVAVPDTTLTYGMGNTLLTVDGQTVTHDDDGNLTLVPVLGFLEALSFDARHRLTSVGGVSYGYDGENQRLSISVNGQVTEYVTNPQAALSQVLVRIQPDGTQTYYVYGLGLLGQETIPAGQSSGEYLTYHFDRRGSTIALSDNAGVVQARMQYSPFGRVQMMGQAETPFLYNGRDGVMTDASGLYYMRARYYHPEIRRFVNRDVLRGTLGRPQSLNRFAFVEGNPVMLIDPLGLEGIQFGDPYVTGEALNVTRESLIIGLVATFGPLAAPLLAKAAVTTAVAAPKATAATLGIADIISSLGYQPEDPQALVGMEFPLLGAAKGIAYTGEACAVAVAGVLNDLRKVTKKVKAKPQDLKFETKRQALRQAKRDAGIPTSQTHKTHIKDVRTDRLGGKGDDLVFENGKTIQHHRTGHKFKDNPKPQHFNNHPETKNHYIYDR